MKKVYLIYFYMKNEELKRPIFANKIFFNKMDARRFCNTLNSASDKKSYLVIRHDLIMDKEYADEIINDIKTMITNHKI